MPKTDIDYTKTVIYTIQHKDNENLLYVGHTTHLTNRSYTHKTRSKKSTDKLYQMIRENGGWEMFDMKPIKQISCSGSIEARIEEEKCRKELNANMNSLRAIRTEDNAEEVALQNKKNSKQYRLDNKIKIQEIKKKYHQDNKEKFILKAKLHYENNKEAIAVKKKEKYETNKEAVLLQQKKYHEANKEARCIKNKKRYTCQCGIESVLCNKPRHEKSVRHIHFMENKI